MRGTPAKIGGGGEGELPSSPVVAATRCLGKTQSLHALVSQAAEVGVAATAEIAGFFAASG